jgi:predicted MPP superfamily phosphohydrolase
MSPTFLFNALMLVIDGLFLHRLMAKRTVAMAVILAFAAGVVALLAAIALERDRFGILRLAAWAIFGHGTILSLGIAALFWRSRRGSAMLAAGSAVALIAIAVDAFLIEPQSLDVSHVTISSAKIKRPCRVVVLADFQVDEIGRYERQVIRAIADAKPDLVLLAGDYVQAAPEDWEHVRYDFHELFREAKLAADARVFAVQGNCDGSEWEGLFSGLNFTTNSETKSFDLGDGLSLTCLSMRASFDPATEIAADRAHYHVVLGHCPNYSLGSVPGDLLIAGHTHGGQVQLPLIGPLMTLSQIPRRWASGLTQLSDGRQLLVSRGTGMERGLAPRLRFLCRPELSVIDLVPGVTDVERNMKTENP